MSISDIQTAARRSLHDTMARPAVYYSGDDVVGLCHVRIVENPVKLGDLAGTNLSYAEAQEVRTRVIFDRAELVFIGALLHRTDFVVLAEDRGYVLDTVMPPDGITVSAEVTRMSTSELTDKETPESLA